MARILHASTETQSRLVEASNRVALIAIDSGGIIQMFNSGAQGLLGYEPSELVAERTFESLVSGTDRNTNFRHLESNALLETNPTLDRLEKLAQLIDSSSEEWALVRKDGSEVIVQVDVSHLLDDHKNDIGYLILLYDLTARKRFENELIEACRMAENASEQKTHFLTHMSHEIRSPLTSILGNAELLADPTLSLSDRESSLKTIQRSGEHLLSLVNNILDLEKIEAGKMEVERRKLAPIPLIEEVLDIFQETCRAKNIHLSYEVVGGIPEVIWSDSMRIKQILVNLVNNAIKFTPSGSVQIIVRSVPSLSANGGSPRSIGISFSVKDTGIGIDNDHQKMLFAPFVQASKHTSREYGGTGLGLAISRRIAQLLGGDVSVQSVLGQGSTFTATIGVGSHDPQPSSEGDLIASSSQTLPVQNIEGRILLVDDSIDIQRLVRAFLTNAGAQVDIADNGQIAIDLIFGKQGDRPDSIYDLVLMDMQMPIMDGCDTTQELRSRGYAGPIVALTANAMLEDRNRCFAVGFTDFATKPINRRELLAICHQWIT